MRSSLQLGLVALLFSLPSCMELSARAHVGYMQPALTGELGLAPSGAPASVLGSVDLEDSLGVEGEGAPYARIEATAGVLNLVASGFTYSSTSRGTLQAEFGDLIIGQLVDTEIEFINAKVGATFDLIDLGFLRLSPGLAVDYVGLDMSVDAVGSGIIGGNEVLDIQAPVPLLFVQAEADVGPVSAIVDAGGVTVDYGDVDGTFVDVEALLRVEPASNLELFAGYRWISLEGAGDASGQEFDGDLVMAGWFVGGALTF